jgi:hypothetical protein
MSTPTNELSRPTFNPNTGVPAAHGPVHGQFTQGQGPSGNPAQQPVFSAPAIAPAAQAPAQPFVQPAPAYDPYGYNPTAQYYHAPAPAAPVGMEQPTQSYQNGVPQGNFGFPQQPTQPQYQAPQVPAQPAFQVPQAPVTPAAQPQAAPQPTVQPQTGNSYIETSINHLTSSLGVSADKFDAVISAAIQYGDPNLVNPAALGVQLTPEQTAQVQQLAQGAVQYVQAENQRVNSIVYAAAGGQEQWNQAAGTFSSVADANTKSYVSYLVDTGNHEQAAQVVLNTVRSYGYQPQGQAPIQASAIAGQQGLSSTAFKDAIGKLKMEAGNQSLESGIFGEKYQLLIQQRALGRSQGLA